MNNKLNEHLENHSESNNEKNYFLQEEKKKLEKLKALDKEKTETTEDESLNSEAA